MQPTTSPRVVCITGFFIIFVVTVWLIGRLTIAARWSPSLLVVVVLETLRSVLFAAFAAAFAFTALLTISGCEPTVSRLVAIVVVSLVELIAPAIGLATTQRLSTMFVRSGELLRSN